MKKILIVKKAITAFGQNVTTISPDNWRKLVSGTDYSVTSDVGGRPEDRITFTNDVVSYGEILIDFQDGEANLRVQAHYINVNNDDFEKTILQWEGGNSYDVGRIVFSSSITKRITIYRDNKIVAGGQFMSIYVKDKVK